MHAHDWRCGERRDEAYEDVHGDVSLDPRFARTLKQFDETELYRHERRVRLWERLRSLYVRWRGYFS